MPWPQDSPCRQLMAGHPFVDEPALWIARGCHRGEVTQANRSWHYTANFSPSVSLSANTSARSHRTALRMWSRLGVSVIWVDRHGAVGWPHDAVYPTLTAHFHSIPKYRDSLPGESHLGHVLHPPLTIYKYRSTLNGLPLSTDRLKLRLKQDGRSP